MLKGVLLDFFYGWARYMLALLSCGVGVLLALNGDYVRFVALCIAAALFFRVDHSKPELREGAKIASGLVLLVYGLSRYMSLEL